MPEEIKEKILNFLHNNSGEFSGKDIAQGIGKTEATTHKWLLVLEAEKRVTIKDYGNLKLVSLRKSL